MQARSHSLQISKDEILANNNVVENNVSMELPGLNIRFAIEVHPSKTNFRATNINKMRAIIHISVSWKHTLNSQLTQMVSALLYRWNIPGCKKLFSKYSFLLLFRHFAEAVFPAGWESFSLPSLKAFFLCLLEFWPLFLLKQFSLKFAL